MIYRCKSCDLPFTPLTGNQKYCNKCRAKGIAYYVPSAIVDKKCLICGKIFSTNISTKIYCSSSCRLKADARKMSAVTKTCAYCNKPFKTGDSKRKYCSEECYIKAKAKRSKENG